MFKNDQKALSPSMSFKQLYKRNLLKQLNSCNFKRCKVTDVLPKFSLMTFPNFKDADVHIFFSATRKYSLHRKVLIHNSLTLARLLKIENAIVESSTSDDGDNHKQWLLHLKHQFNDSRLEGSGELVVSVSKAHDLFFC